jgi:putative transcriptional regulator
MINEHEEILDMPISIYLGGPVEVERGFILHSEDYKKNLLFHVEGGLAVSSNGEILQDIACGKGPEYKIFAVGYTAWIAGQLETEIENNFWIASDTSMDIIFSEDNSAKWSNAVQRLGIISSLFTGELGKC